MASEQSMRRLDEILSKAGEQWREEDLDDIMALLDKDYTKPQQEPAPAVQEPAPVLDPEKFMQEQSEPVSRRSMALPDLNSLILQEEESAFLPCRDSCGFTGRRKKGIPGLPMTSSPPGRNLFPGSPTGQAPASSRISAKLRKRPKRNGWRSLWAS